MTSVFKSPLDELLPALHVLDGLLERSSQLAEALHSGGERAATPQNAGSLRQPELALPPGYPRYSPAQSTEMPSSQIQPSSRLGLLQQQFDLPIFDLDVILIALAPELDRRYEQIYAYLQQDGRSVRPSVNLVLNLLCADAAEKLQRRSHFAPIAPLRHNDLLQLSPPQPTNQSSLLAQEISLDPAIVRYLLHETGLDADFSPSRSLILATVPAEQTDLPAPLVQQISAIAQNSSSTQPIRLYLQGPDAVTSHQFAQVLAHQLSRPLLIVDLDDLIRQPEQFRQRLKRLGRNAWLQNTVLYLHSVDSLHQDTTNHLYPFLINLLAETNAPIVVAGRQSWQPSADWGLGIVTISLTVPGFGDRLKCWKTRLASVGLTVEQGTIEALADRFQLTPTQIQGAIATTQNQLAYELEPASIEAVLFQAARNQSGHHLNRLTQPIQPRYVWSDLVLPAVQFEQLQEVCTHLQHRHTVFETWGFDHKLSLGKGVNALFAGPSGTGKTMAAEVIAKSLQLDLYRIDLSQVVSKYIGETEKNLSQIFTAAASTNAILLFDEADSLFGKRTEIKDSHDRYANIEVGYLLQQMEAYEGLAILTTNLKSNLDEAFIRRLRFIIDFPLPSVQERYRIWQHIWPQSLPLDSEINWIVVAKQFDLTGGNIRNIALATAFLAANEGDKVTISHIQQAIRREYQKMGKPMTNEAFEDLS
ncbi:MULTISPECIES: ATP-binding protein [Cyanophyceae]|uniref:ATP-binding protein n=1 Tax=Leptolyngbya subtilissima DQ-A4 TaxID=2933933 RepID=A0ABV0K0B0_9CYAN|nr:ATP-binding protein [Nodosilinea sp. FACHB-141]MBD2112571.1 AAA family ATPase [Nodosilinea sp. FACHB-141]